ncbi:filament-like plant protein 4 isoform X1 [Typha latifolia]|uniref:filament-like plant protein 4 isoform X1 n=2 Tax=Typha latifolia TaxID=4733 RepID=UPI003C2AE854
MDRRSWPWKKKSSEKTINATDSVVSSSPSSGGNKEDQNSTKRVKYVQISVETYEHLTDMEEQVKVLNEKLSVAQSDMTTKDDLVKQHTKVAEEAISGWEKAEEEAAELKHQLESVMLSKMTAEERASQLDGALKECMKQVRNVKEESEQKLHDVVLMKTKQWENVKADIEAKLVDCEQELLRATSENAALSRSLQEHSNLLMKISDENSQAETQIEMLKNNIQSREREINSLKYELHVVSKELEIRNEEKNMSIRSADVAIKQHLEDIKKISKLEAECQRLRGLVRKKLPGPAALAQMKLEVENLGHDYGETRFRRSPARNASTYHALAPSPDFAFESIQQYHKENEFLTARLSAMDEETKMLKEALSKRNSELQASRNMFAKVATKLRKLEVQMLPLNQQKIPSNLNMDIHFDNGSNPPSLTSMSEDGVDDEGSSSECWSTALISELSQFKKGKDVGGGTKAEKSNNLELMDDFLEMEKLACLPADTNGAITSPESIVDNMKIEDAETTVSVVIQRDNGVKGKKPDLVPCESLSSHNQQPSEEFASSDSDSPLLKLKSRIASIFNSQVQINDVGEVIKNICLALMDTQEMPQNCIVSILNGSPESSHIMSKQCHEDLGGTIGSRMQLKQDGNLGSDANHTIDQNLRNAISQILTFITSIAKKTSEAKGQPPEYHGLSEKVEQFSTSVDIVLSSEKKLYNFIILLSDILTTTGVISFMSCNKDNEGEASNLDYVDKVTLLENRVGQQQQTKEDSVCSILSHSSSEPEFDQPIVSGFESRTTDQEYEQLRLEKKNVEMELANCNELLDHSKLKLIETEQTLAELKSQLAASQKSNILAETQLKCMAESYKLLEARSQELEAEINFLRTKTETLGDELLEERHSHQEDLAKIDDLLEQIKRIEKSSMCTDADNGMKTKQEREIAATAEKLAECQETILLLGRQLQALRPPKESFASSPNNRQRTNDEYFEDKPHPTDAYSPHTPLSPGQPELENAAALVTQRTGGESPLVGCNSHMSPPDAEESLFPQSPSSSKRQKFRSSRPSSSSSSPLPEKQGRGFSRFFSKGKSEN